jgi:hypothetical protein
MIIFISLSFFGCVSGPESINFNKLTSETFILSRVTYMTNMEEYNQDIPKIFSILPIKNVIKQIESKFNISIDTDSFIEADSQIKSYNFGMPNYFIELETDALQKVSIFFGNFHQEKEMNVTISLNIYEDGKLKYQTSASVYVPRWEL